LGEVTETWEAEALGFCFSVSVPLFISALDTFAMVRMAEVKRSNSGLFGGRFIAFLRLFGGEMRSACRLLIGDALLF
jgi:hypothetical protein